MDMAKKEKDLEGSRNSSHCSTKRITNYIKAKIDKPPKNYKY